MQFGTLYKNVKHGTNDNDPSKYITVNLISILPWFWNDCTTNRQPCCLVKTSLSTPPVIIVIYLLYSKSNFIMFEHVSLYTNYSHPTFRKQESAYYFTLHVFCWNCDVCMYELVYRTYNLHVCICQGYETCIQTRHHAQCWNISFRYTSQKLVYEIITIS